MQSRPTLPQIRHLARSGKAAALTGLRQLMSGQRARLNAVRERDAAYQHASHLESDVKTRGGQEQKEQEQRAANAVKKLSLLPAGRRSVRRLAVREYRRLVDREQRATERGYKLSCYNSLLAKTGELTGEEIVQAAELRRALGIAPQSPKDFFG